MYVRHTEVPPLQVRAQWRVDAYHFNHVRCALRRLGPELRLSPPGLKHLDLILQPGAWVVVDRALNDMPVLAWMDFCTTGRTGLHEPVPCELRYFHAYAGMIMNRALAGMELSLAADRAARESAEREVRILPFPGCGGAESAE